MRWHVVSSILVACLCAAYYGMLPTLKLSSVDALELFALEQSRDLVNASDVLLKTHNTFSGIGCAAGQTRDNVAVALAAYLADVPEFVRTSILQKALPKADGDFSSTIETEKSSDGKTTFVLGFWHSQLHGNTIESCISVAGTEVELADKVIGTSVRKVQNTVGYVSCKCSFGAYFCSQCPLLEESEERVPLLVPTRISLRQQKEMQLALKAHAVKKIQEFKRKPGLLSSLQPEESDDAVRMPLV